MCRIILSSLHFNAVAVVKISATNYDNILFALYIKKAIRLKLSTISQLHCNKILINIFQDKI